jgi:hypothetical protein
MKLKKILVGLLASFIFVICGCAANNQQATYPQNGTRQKEISAINAPINAEVQAAKNIIQSGIKP